MKVDIGSGSRDHWYKENEEGWLRLDCDKYKDVVQWTCPERMPIESNTVEEAFIGKLLIEISLDDHKKLAEELIRIMKDDGKIIIECYRGVLGFKEFFEHMYKGGWKVVKMELNNFYIDDNVDMSTYIIELRLLK